MLDWLKSLLHRKKSLPEAAEKPMETKEKECISRTLMKECGCYPPDKHVDIPEIAELAKKQPASCIWGRELEKHERMLAIREKNLERQRNVLGSGLKSRNFRPRPAHEKKLFKLDKKAEDD